MGGTRRQAPPGTPARATVMDFELSETQTLLKDSARRFLAENYTAAAQRGARAAGRSDVIWKAFADLGWLGAPFAEEYGGSGGDCTDVAIIMEELGRALGVEPYLSTIVLCGGLLAREGSAAQQLSLMSRMAAGDHFMALAHAEPRSRYDLAHVETTAHPAQTGHWRLNGRKSLVLHGGTADDFIVVARTGGETAERDGLSLYIVPRDAAGLEIRDYPTVDGAHACDLALDDVTVGDDAILGQVGRGYQPLAEAIEMGRLAICAEAVGLMDVTLTATLDYVRTRVQFGRPIGTFQVVQHRFADMFVELEQTRSLLYLAAIRLRDGHVDAPAAVSALKVQTGRAGRFIGQQGVQLHGGVGMTDDLNIGWALKRLLAIEFLFGDVDFHVDRFQQLRVAAPSASVLSS